MTDQIREKLKKILELSKRGIDGEKDNAQRILDEMVKKYDTSLDELNSEVCKECYFPYKNNPEKELILYILRSISDKEFRSYTDKTLGMELTVSENIQAEIMTVTLLRQYRKELKNLPRAFAVANQLYSKRKSEPKELTEKEKKANEELQRLARGFNKTCFDKQLN